MPSSDLILANTNRSVMEKEKSYRDSVEMSVRVVGGVDVGTGDEGLYKWT